MNVSSFSAVLTILAFTVNITVQMTKDAVPIPTKMWTVIVSLFVTTAAAATASSAGYFEMNTANVLTAVSGSFITSYISMYGFDLFKELYNRFKDGNNINKE